MEGTITDIGLSVNEKGKVIQSIGNCVKAIHYDERLKEMFRYNEMTDMVEVYGAWWKQSSVTISDNDVNNIRLYLETTYGLAHEKRVCQVKCVSFFIFYQRLYTAADFCVKYPFRSIPETVVKRTVE